MVHNPLDIIEREGKQKLNIQREDAHIPIQCAYRKQASYYTYNWSIIVSLHANTNPYFPSRRWVVSLYPPYPPHAEACCSDNCSPKLMTSPGALVCVLVCVSVCVYEDNRKEMQLPHNERTVASNGHITKEEPRKEKQGWGV